MSYVELLNNDSLNVVYNLLKRTTKAYSQGASQDDIIYKHLDENVDYNSCLAMMLEHFDNAIEKIIEGNLNEATNEMNAAFFDKKTGKIYDYVIQSGIYDELAKLHKEKTLPISSIEKGSKIIIDDNRKDKTNEIDIRDIQKYYTTVYPLA